MKMKIRLKSVEPSQAGQVFTFETPGSGSKASVVIKLEEGRFSDDETSLKVAKAYVANVLQALAEETKDARMTVEQIAAIEVPKAERSRY